ncbi:MAG: hypothetical protein LBN38_02645 [Verrucomicrobiota bacterium]|nr:hypothetical protein [Verrucomicrobiota bacterium]
MMKKKNDNAGYGMFTSIYWVVGGGILLGVALSVGFKDEIGLDRMELGSMLGIGIALAYLLLALVDGFVQYRAFKANPLPDDLDLSDRAIAREQLTALKGHTPLLRHIRRLLAAWAVGASGPQVATIAANQMNRTLVMLGVEGVGIFAILFACADFGPPQMILTLSSVLMVMVILVAIGRFQLASHLAGYIESNLLARIGNDSPAAAADSFASAAAQAVATSTEALAQAQTQAADAFARMQEKAGGQLAQAQSAVAKQLDRITEMAASIDRILKLQESVNGALQGISATEEFKSTLLELKRHLSESDELLRNAAKPRTIRLVEKDPE